MSKRFGQKREPNCYCTPHLSCRVCAAAAVPLVPIFGGDSLSNTQRIAAEENHAAALANECVVHSMFDDICDSWVLALKSAGVDETIIAAARETVEDYIGNYYGGF